MIEMARRHGFSAKFTGSGGAIVCLRREPVSEEEAGRIRDEFRAQVRGVAARRDAALSVRVRG